jgi:hypothetical protein
MGRDERCGRQQGEQEKNKVKNRTLKSKGAAPGKTSTAAPQNGKNEPHYHPKGARATWWTRRGRGARLSGEGEAQNGNSG